MKKIVLIWTVFILSISCFARNGATIEFATKAHDFGVVTEEDRTATYNFTFKNTGSGPLVINKAVASCGCTTPDYPKEPIAVGASASIRVTYNTVGRPGAFHKTITVYSNDMENPNIVLTISGTVASKTESTERTYPKEMQGLRLERTQVNFFNAKIGNTETETINVINTSNSSIRISFNKVPKHIIVTASSYVLRSHETGKLTIRYQSAKAHDFGKREDAFYVVINGKNKINPGNRIYIIAFITENFSHHNGEELGNAPKADFSISRINYGNMVRGTQKTAYLQLSNKGKSPLYIRKIIPEYDGIMVTPDRKEILAGKTANVKIDFNAGTFEGYVVKRISFITNDPQNSFFKVYATAQVSTK